jgi:hypothetical protein
MRIAGADLAYRYSKDDLNAFKKPFGGRGVIYLYFDNETPGEALEAYRTIMEALAPEVIVLPVVFISDPVVDVASLYRDFLAISQEYARRIWK